MNKVTAWVVTFWPSEHVLRALGASEPLEDEAVLLFLSLESATDYLVKSGMLGASIVEVEVRPVGGSGAPKQAANIVEPPPERLAAATLH